MEARPAWVRHGLVYGGVAAVATLVVNGVSQVMRSSDFCHPGSAAGVLPYLSFALFVVITALAGRATVKAGQPVGAGALAGLVAAGVSGLAGIALLLVSLGNVDRALQCAQAQTSSPLPSADTFRLFSILFTLIAIGIGLGIGATAGAIGGLRAGARAQTS
jgi:hypothetical protein